MRWWRRTKRDAGPDDWLALARRGMGPDDGSRRDVERRLIAVGVAVPAVMTASTKAAATLSAVGASSKLSSGAAVGSVSSKLTSGAALGGASAKVSSGAALGAASAAQGTLGAIGVGKIAVVAVAVGAGGAGAYEAYDAVVQTTPARGDHIFTASDAKPSPVNQRVLRRASGRERSPVAGSTETTVAPPNEPPAVEQEVTDGALSAPKSHLVPVPEVPSAAKAESPARKGSSLAEGASPNGSLVSKSLPSGAAIKAELASLHEIQAALARGDGAQALQRLRELDRAVPGGNLGPERRVSEVLALCQIGNTLQATRMAQRLLARDGSFYARRLQESCAASDFINRTKDSALGEKRR